MKKRYGWLWAGIALLGLLGVLLALLPEPRNTLIRWALPEKYTVWYGIWEWSSLEPAQIEQIARNFAASGDAKKLAFAAILGQTLGERFGSKGQYARPFGQSPEEKSEYAMPQETLDNWRKMALEKAAPDDVLLLNMLATYGVAKNNSAKAVSDEAILRWQQAEPDNLAPLLHQQTLSIQELLEQAKTRHHYQEYNYAISRWMYQTLLQQLPNQQKSISTEVMGIEGDARFYNIKPLIDFCMKSPPKRSSQDWRLCQSIAQKLREKSSDTVVGIAGISILYTLANSDAEKQTLDNERAYIRETLKQKDSLTNGVKIFKNYLLRLQDESINSELQEIEYFLQKEDLPLKPLK